MIRLETPRLVLRAPELADLDGYLTLNNDPQVLRYVGSSLARDANGILAWIEGLSVRFPPGSRRGVWVAERGGGFAGSFMLRPSKDTGELELGYRLVPSLWGQGLATEACRTLIGLAPKERVVARVHRDNLASRATAERLGMALVRGYDRNGEPTVEYATTPSRQSVRR